MTPLKHFWITVAAVVVGVNVSSVIDRLDPASLALGSTAIVGGAVVSVGLWSWFNGRRGLNQWPEPYGRYYSEWLDLPEGSGDYYAWLAAKHGNREPWRTWAAREKALDG